MAADEAFKARFDAAMQNKVIVVTSGMLQDPVLAKTAHAMLRFAPDRVHAVCDDEFAGERIGSWCPQFAHLDIPVISRSEAELLDLPCVVGFAPVGGALSQKDHSFLQGRVNQGRYVLNGLHDLLVDSPYALNLREFDNARRWIAEGVPLHSERILTVGTSYSIGKMTTTAAVVAGIADLQFATDWVATGQTGMLLTGRGCCIDAIPLDWASGNIEHWVAEADARSDYVLIEGQGSLFHPGFSIGVPVLMQVSRPQQLLLCHRLGQKDMGVFPEPLPTLSRAIEAHNQLAQSLDIPSQVTAISLDSSRVTHEQYVTERLAIEAETGLPISDPIRDGAADLAGALVAASKGRA